MAPLIGTLSPINSGGCQDRLSHLFLVKDYFFLDDADLVYLIPSPWKKNDGGVRFHYESPRTNAVFQIGEQLTRQVSSLRPAPPCGFV